MNRISRESLAGGRNIPVESQEHRRGRSLAGGVSREGEENLDLFSRNRNSLLINLNNESGGRNVPEKSERISVGSAKLGRSGMDDLLSADIGKHDYDWLLTPPGTPLFSSSDASEHQPSLAAPRSRSTARSVSTAKASRLSVSQSENGHSTRPARSSSVTRPAISSTHSSSYYSNNNRTSILNTSTASVTSRPSTPGSRSNTLYTSRPSAPTSRSVPSRSSTPAKTRPPPSSPGDKTRPLHNSRPSTPTARPRTPTNLNSNLNSSAARSNSRPSTPTRRPIAPAPAPTTGRSPSVGRIPATNGRNPAPLSRPSSPGPRVRAPVQPLPLPDFPLDVPPNLRTKLPERPVSAGRARPGMALTVRANSNSEPPAPAIPNRRQSSSPIVSRGRFPENSPKTSLHSNGHGVTIPPEIQKSVVSEAAVRKPMKPATATDSTGFGRTISKKSIDMALRHMDIRQSVGGIRGASLFPQSIRSAAPKGRPARMSEATSPVINNGVAVENYQNCNGMISVDCNGAVSENGNNTVKSPDREYQMVMANEPDIYGSSRYDAILLKEDSKNMNWLHSIEDKSDEISIFDHRFEPLPEPFGLL